MSEKQFRITTNPMSKSVAFDKKEKKYYIGIELEDLLNALSDENGHLKEENEQLKEKNEKLQWELVKTREDLDYFANLKVSAIRGSDCGHDRCYVTSMQKKGD